MTKKTIPETIENRWDILYRDYPEIYDRFGKVPKTPTAVEVVHQHFPLGGKTVADIGCGSGLSTFELSRVAARVIGVEPEAAMRQIAEQEAREQGLKNVEFCEGWAEKMPLPDQSVDAVVAVTLASLYSQEGIAAYVREAERVVRPGGIVLAVDIASGWYGGDLADIILEKPRAEMGLEPPDQYFPELGYKRINFFTRQDYGSLENILETYGFIFGKNAIDYIREHNITVINWKFSIHYRWVQ